MRVHWLQHADFEGLGGLGPWLAAQGHALRGTRLQAGEPLPAPAEFDALVVMGGPMNIDEHAQHPWLPAEKALIRAAIAAGKRVLGICLGAQLVADVLGGPVTRNAETEIGWFPLRLTPEGRTHPLLAGLPQTFTGFHWHGDTYALPPGALRLADSAACAQQAFAWDGGRVLGLQFHPEVRARDAREWLRHECVVPSRWVQEPAAILADRAAFAANNRWLRAIAERFFA
ncbi:MAG: type 1 glutamine amidotransferase [Nevskia sp.]